MIKPYLSDLINKHKTHGLARHHSGNKSWIEKTSSDWKIQLIMALILFLLKILMRLELCIQEVWLVLKQMKLSWTFLYLFCKNIKKS